MPAELLPCPLCGWKVAWGDGATESPYITEDGDEVFTIACPDCGYGIAPSDTIDGVVSNWNRLADIKVENFNVVQQISVQCRFFGLPECASKIPCVDSSCDCIHK